MEIKALAEKYMKTDSISEKRELKQILIDRCIDLAKKEYNIYSKFDMLHISQYDGDYRHDRGNIDIIRVTQNEILCEYEDYCGSSRYSENLRFSLEDLENKDLMKLENDVLQKRIQYLQNNRSHHMTQIDLIDRKIAELSK